MLFDMDLKVASAASAGTDVAIERMMSAIHDGVIGA
jgi:hypothetical protein